MAKSDVATARLVLGYLSDKGLEKTKSAFSEECQYLGKPNENDMVYEQKLSMIIEEYFLLKGHDKCSKQDPENVLQFLWKQFDVLVGQLKHATIHAVKEKSKGLTNQNVRVREMNRQNRARIEKKNKRSTFVVNQDLYNTVQNINKTCTPSQVVSTPQILITGNLNEIPGSCVSKSSNIAHGSPSNFPQPSPNNVQAITRYEAWSGKNTRTPNSQGLGTVNSSSLSCGNMVVGDKLLLSNQVLCLDQLKSPKRKSVQPKKRPVAEDSAGVSSTSSCLPGQIDLTPPSEDEFDLTHVVEMVLGQPLFSEKLAENINRAVEIDMPTNKEDENAQAKVLDSSKVENIVDMMKADPVFEDLFSSFESFTNSSEESQYYTACEESILETSSQKLSGHADQSKPVPQDDNCESFIKTSEESQYYRACEESRLQKSSQKISGHADHTKAVAQDDNCASEVTDALLLLASSPAKVISASPLQTPLKEISKENPNRSTTVQVLVGPLSSVSHPDIVPVVVSPWRTKATPNSTTQTDISHVRQLDFSSEGNSPETGIVAQNVFTKGVSTSSAMAPCAEKVPSGDGTAESQANDESHQGDTPHRTTVPKQQNIPGTNVDGRQSNCEEKSSQKRTLVNSTKNTVGDEIKQCRQSDECVNDSGEKQTRDDSSNATGNSIPSSDNEESSLCVLEELATNALSQSTYKHEEKIQESVLHSLGNDVSACSSKAGIDTPETPDKLTEDAVEGKKDEPFLSVIEVTSDRQVRMRGDMKRATSADDKGKRFSRSLGSSHDVAETGDKSDEQGGHIAFLPEKKENKRQKRQKSVVKKSKNRTDGHLYTSILERPQESTQEGEKERHVVSETKPENTDPGYESFSKNSVQNKKTKKGKKKGMVLTTNYGKLDNPLFSAVPEQLVESEVKNVEMKKKEKCVGSKTMCISDDDDLSVTFPESKNQKDLKQDAGESIPETGQGTESTSSTKSAKTNKRKLKKNKDFPSGSKKRRPLVPLGMDIDKFLSALDYSEEN